MASDGGIPFYGSDYYGDTKVAKWLLLKKSIKCEKVRWCLNMETIKAQERLKPGKQSDR